MRLKHTTLLAILATAYFFILRALGTVSPNIFLNRGAAQTATILSLLFCLVFMLFFITFKSAFLADSEKALKVSSAWAIAGYAAMSFVYAVELINILQINVLPSLLNSRLIAAVKPVVPWLTSLFVLVFFLTFYQERKNNRTAATLKQPLLFAVLGGVLALLLRSLILVGYLSGKTGQWFMDFSGPDLIFGLVLSSVSFLFLEYFFLSFFFERDILHRSPN